MSLFLSLLFAMYVGVNTFFYASTFHFFTFKAKQISLGHPYNPFSQENKTGFQALQWGNGMKNDWVLR